MLSSINEYLSDQTDAVQAEIGPVLHLATPRQIRRLRRTLTEFREGVSLETLKKWKRTVEDYRNLKSGSIDRIGWAYHNDFNSVLLKKKKGVISWSQSALDAATNLVEGNDVILSPLLLAQSWGPIISDAFAISKNDNGYILPSPSFFMKTISEINKLTPKVHTSGLSYVATGAQPTEDFKYMNMLSQNCELPISTEGRLYLHDLTAHGDNFLIPKFYLNAGRQKIFAVTHLFDCIKNRDAELFDVLEEYHLGGLTILEVLDGISMEVDISLGRQQNVGASRNSKKMFSMIYDTFLRTDIFYGSESASEYTFRVAKNLLPSTHPKHTRLRKILAEYMQELKSQPSSSRSQFTPTGILDSLNRSLQEVEAALTSKTQPKKVVFSNGLQSFKS